MPLTQSHMWCHPCYTSSWEKIHPRIRGKGAVASNGGSSSTSYCRISLDWHPFQSVFIFHVNVVMRECKICTIEYVYCTITPCSPNAPCIAGGHSCFSVNDFTLSDLLQQWFEMPSFPYCNEEFGGLHSTIWWSACMSCLGDLPKSIWMDLVILRGQRAAMGCTDDHCVLVAWQIWSWYEWTMWAVEFKEVFWRLWGSVSGRMMESYWCIQAGCYEGGWLSGKHSRPLMIG